MAKKAKNSDTLNKLREVVKKSYQKKIEDIVKNEVAYRAKKIISNNIQREVYSKDYGGSRSLRTYDFNNPKNLKTYISTEQNGENSRIKLTIRNETPAISIFNEDFWLFGDSWNKKVKSDYPGILGYWIEVGSVPVLWDNGNEQYVNKIFKFTDKNGVEHTITKAFPPRPWMEESKKEFHSGAITDALKEGMKRNGLLK